MSDRLGPIALEGMGGRLVGGGYSEDRGYSSQVAKAIDEEVAKIIEEGMQKAKDALTKYRPALEAISKKLAAVETSATRQRSAESTRDKTRKNRGVGQSGLARAATSCSCKPPWQTASPQRTCHQRP